MDGFLKFFTAPGDPIERCLSVPELREYVADAGFVNSLLSMCDRAKSAKTPEEMSKVTREMMQDPRLTQCAMLGAGVKLSVKEEDVKKAERVGDIAKRSPLRVEDMIAAGEEKDAASAKSIGTEAFSKKNYSRALAFWCRALTLVRQRGFEDEEMCEVIYANISQALLKEGGYASRAEQAATKALSYSDTLYSSPLREKILYRRALAREQLKKYEEALRDAQKTSDAGLVDRLRKKLDHQRVQESAKLERKQEEHDLARPRAAGIELSSTASPSSTAGYLAEQDYSRSLLKRLEDSVDTISLGAGDHSATYIEITHLQPSSSSVDLSVTSKNSKRAMYYDIDLVCAWKGHHQSFDLDNQEEHTIKGTIRLYNVSQETRYEPGRDPNVAYMYQLGYENIPDPAWFDGTVATPQAPEWARLLIDGAHDLYEALAHHLDSILLEYRSRL